MIWYNTFQRVRVREKIGKSLSHSHAQRVPWNVTTIYLINNTQVIRAQKNIYANSARFALSLSFSFYIIPIICNAFHFIFLKLLQDTTWLNGSMRREFSFFSLKNNDNVFFIHAGKWQLCMREGMMIVERWWWFVFKIQIHLHRHEIWLIILLIKWTNE